MGLLDLLGPDETTVLFAFNDSTGASNPGTVKTKVGTAVDLATLGTELVVFRTTDAGGTRRGLGDPPVDFTIPLLASATSYDNLVTGLGQLARWLRDPPGPLRWTVGSTVRYMDLLGTTQLPALLRGQNEAGLISTRFSSMGPIPITMLRQPWMRGAEVTSTPATVPNDPATSTKVRVYPVTIPGDLPTPAKVVVQMGATSSVARVLIAHRAQGAQASTVMSDYLDETGFAQAEASGRGWTVTLGADTAGVVDANASPGSGTSAAETSYTSNPTTMATRVHLTRTTKMDSLRGSWDIYATIKASAAARHVLQVAWAPVAATNPATRGDEAVHDTSVLGTPPAFGYVAKKLGRLTIPETGALSGVTVDLLSRRESGTGTLRWDAIWFVPADRQATVVAVPGGSSSVLGKNLTSPPFKLTADPTWIAGGVIGDSIYLNSPNEAAGMGPNTGTDLPDGRNRYTFSFSAFGVADWTVRVVNVTDNTETISRSGSGGQLVTLDFDAAAGKLYQAQINNPTGDGNLAAASITHQFLASLAQNEQFRTDPGPRYGVDRLDSSGNITGSLTIEGAVPAILPPGLNHIMVRAEQVPLALYEEGQSLRANTPTVSVVYSPRYAL